MTCSIMFIRIMLTHLRLRTPEHFRFLNALCTRTLLPLHGDIDFSRQVANHRPAVRFSVDSVTALCCSRAVFVHVLGMVRRVSRTGRPACVEGYKKRQSSG